MLNRARRAKAIAMGAVNDVTSHSMKKQDAIPDVIYCVIYKEPPNNSTTNKTNEVVSSTNTSDNDSKKKTNTSPSTSDTSSPSTLDVSYKSEGKLLALDLMQHM